MLGVLATSATSAAGKFERFQIAYIDSRPVQAAERWTDKGTAPGSQESESGRDAELIKRDADIVRRFRERLAEAFDSPASYPFFRRDWLPGEDADVALLWIFKSNKQILDRSDEDIINAIVESQRRHRRG